MVQFDVYATHYSISTTTEAMVTNISPTIGRRNNGCRGAADSSERMDSAFRGLTVGRRPQKQVSPELRQSSCRGAVQSDVVGDNRRLVGGGDKSLFVSVWKSLNRGRSAVIETRSRDLAGPCTWSAHACKLVSSGRRSVRCELDVDANGRTDGRVD